MQTSEAPGSLGHKGPFEPESCLSCDAHRRGSRRYQAPCGSRERPRRIDASSTSQFPLRSLPGVTEGQALMHVLSAILPRRTAADSAEDAHIASRPWRSSGCLYSPPDFSLRSRKVPFKLKHFCKRGVGFGEGIIQRNRPERVLLCPGRHVLGGQSSCKRLTGINAAKGGMWQRIVGFSLDGLLEVRDRLLEVLGPASGLVVVVTAFQVERVGVGSLGCPFGRSFVHRG